jgi:hypothetical protein
MAKYASQLKDFRDLLAATASVKNLPDAIIEKDYFVVRALRALFEAVPGPARIQGWHQPREGFESIGGFSEDIDLQS